VDINGQRYLLLREAEDFSNRSSRFLWHPQRAALILAPNQDLRLPASDPATALVFWDTLQPLANDKYGQQGRIAGNRLQYNAGGGFLPLVDDYLHPVQAEAGDFDDIALGGDDLLAAVYSNQSNSHGVLLFHLRRRWQSTAALPERARRVWIDADDTVWCLAGSRVFACKGAPLPHGYVPSPQHFEPATVNPEPFGLFWQVTFAASDRPLALCGDADNLYVLIHDGAGNQSILSRSLQPDEQAWQRFPIDSDTPFTVDMHSLGTDRFALLAPAQEGDSEFRQRDCAIVQLQRATDDATDNAALLIRERYPMLSQAQARFVTSADSRVRYQARVEPGSEAASAGFDVYPRELLPLQRPQYYVSALATLLIPLDSGMPDTVWHRLYLEGCIPPGCRVLIYAKTYNSPEQRSKTPYIKQPEWVWCQHRSDQPFGKGLVENKENESGLFELLLQRDGGPVRRMTGRYLQLRLHLEGNGRNTPSVHALKVYYPRFCYQENYLPEHFRQELAVDPTLDGQRANGADVRERLLAGFEGAWTPLETQIAGAEALLSALHTPLQHLPWLAELFGQTLAESWPEARKRRWLDNTGELQRCRGTLAGVQLALDIVTDGAVQRGEVVVVENFRLRRTMATILGLNMDDANHPLTLGTGESGNSIVGDSLILSDTDAREFLALFAPGLADQEETEIVEAFFDKYAHEVTVLLHGRAKGLRDSVQEMLQQQMPAHVQWQLVETDHPFVLGLSPLLSVDTYLETRPAARRVRLNDTWLGEEGVLSNIAALSPQDVNRAEAIYSTGAKHE
jgi:phage tail-like protein